MSETLTVYDGTEVEVEVLRPLSGGGARVEIDAQNGPRWRVDVTSTGELSEVITSWDSDNELADIETPEWIDDVLTRLARA